MAEGIAKPKEERQQQEPNDHADQCVPEYLPETAHQVPYHIGKVPVRLKKKGSRHRNQWQRQAQP